MTSKNPSNGDPGGDPNRQSKWDENLKNLGFDGDCEWSEEVANAAWRKIRTHVHPNDVEDVQNEVLVRTWHWLSRCFLSDPNDVKANRAKFFLGVARITIRSIIQYYKQNDRAKRCQSAGELIERTRNQTVRTPVYEADDLEGLRSTLMTLPDFERTLIELVYLHGHSVAECCRMLGIPKHTGYAAVERAILLLEQ